MSDPKQLVDKLWNYCNILRDDGLSYGDYVEQLTYLLFLKMADEQAKPPFNRDVASRSSTAGSRPPSLTTGSHCSPSRSDKPYTTTAPPKSSAYPVIKPQHCVAPP
ncbi:MAG: type I restriction-modification system subunit M N-terminal domain-containing protein, partial [Mycobacterium sp.]